MTAGVRGLVIAIELFGLSVTITRGGLMYTYMKRLGISLVLEAEML